MPYDAGARGVSKLARDLLAGSALVVVLAATAHAQGASQPASQATPTQRDADTDEVIIIGNPTTAGDSSVGRLTQPIIDTPQSISTISSFELEIRGVSDLNDALRTVPGVTLGAGEFSWQGNTPTIRGFVARNDIYMDGMRDFGSYYRDPFNLEQIEVLQGPSSVYFGRGSTGGVVNQTSKRPTGDDHMNLSVGAGTEDTYRITADLEGGVDDVLAARVAIMAHTNGVAERDVAEYQRWGVAPSLAFGLGTPTRLTASYLHQAEDNIPDYGHPWYFGRPAPVERDTFYGHDSDFLETDVDVVTARIEHDLNDTITIRDQIRYGNYYRDFRISEAVLAPGTTAAQPIDTVDVAYNMWSGDSTETALMNQLDAVMDLDTGGIGHTIVAGFEVGKETSAPVFENSLGVPTQPLLNPDPTRPFTATVVYPRVTADTEADTVAFYVIDTIRLSERWELALGARWDRFDANYRGVTRNPAGAITAVTEIPQVDEAPSGRIAVTFKPTDNANIYVAAGTSFNPSAEGISQITSGRGLGVGSRDLDPEENETYEAGFKLDLFNSQVMLTGAAFHIQKSNARVPDPNNSGFNMTEGEQQVDGAQFQIVGYITPDWYVSGAYTFLDSEVTKSSAGGAIVGRQLINAPEQSASVLTEFRVLPSVMIGASAIYMDERLAQNTGAIPLVAPSYTTVDAMAKYELNDNTTIQLNVFNVADEEFYDQIHPFRAVPGAGRSAMLTFGVKY